MYLTVKPTIHVFICSFFLPISTSTLRIRSSKLMVNFNYELSKIKKNIYIYS